MSPPAFRASTGSISVDYRNDNGQILLGQGEWEFVTKWSSAGNGTIHVYNDPPSIKAIGVAYLASTISQVTEQVIEASNFSSRSRTPRVGEVVLLENTSGYLAALALSKITKTAESEHGTLLEADYVILTDRGRDFSQLGENRFVEATRLIDDAVLQLKEVSSSINFEARSGNPGIGHNNPPLEFALYADDLEEAKAVLVSSRDQLVQGKIEEAVLKRNMESLQSKSSAIKEWAVEQLKEFSSSAIKSAGAAAGLAAVGILVKLSGAFEAVLAAIGSLF